MSWFDIPTWLQLLVALVVLLVGVGLCIFFSVRIGVVVLGLGIGLVVVTGRDGSDRRGYKF